MLGCPPRVNGLGPSLAIPMALTALGISQHDVDLFEVSNTTSLALAHTKIRPDK
jgi:acetyl-CoA acetyltransferase